VSGEPISSRAGPRDWSARHTRDQRQLLGNGRVPHVPQPDRRRFRPSDKPMDCLHRFFPSPLTIPASLTGWIGRGGSYKLRPTAWTRHAGVWPSSPPGASAPRGAGPTPGSNSPTADRTSDRERHSDPAAGSAGWSRHEREFRQALLPLLRGALWPSACVAFDAVSLPQVTKSP
jgi:hypothetical protein